MATQGTKQGKVYLIGAGPGDPGLMTLKGKEILSRADVIIYDYLANKAFLAYAKPQAELIYVGKKGGDHTMAQEQINRLIVEKSQTGKTIARLKGGDPFIFRPGGEKKPRSWWPKEFPSRWCRALRRPYPSRHTPAFP